jgi:integrase
MSDYLPAEPETVSIPRMPTLTVAKAVDLYIGDLQRRSRSQSGRTGASYRSTLSKFVDQLEDEHGRRCAVTAIHPDDCRRFLDRYLRRAPNYQALIYSQLNSFLTWLYKQERIKRNPLDFVPRPRRVSAADLDVVTVDTNDVPLLFQACRNPSERLAIAILAYMGPRRHAAATRRLRHYNREAGTIEFQEKGGKTIRKPVPDELRRLLDAAIDAGVIVEPDDYLIPPEGILTRSGDRDDRIIWRLVTRVAERAGVRCTVHALRAAFATFYLEHYPEKGILSLQALMGHESIQTTQVYLRKVDRRAQMEQVRDLAWSEVGVVEPAITPTQALDADLAPAAKPGLPTYRENPLVGAGGFEPPYADSQAAEGEGRRPAYEDGPDGAVHR